tara:strand:- start:252 stop:572 length:321 start_codon:yes stop_codon:yes gene_type:complete
VEKISASHILIMHKESQDSRSDISKNDALKKINKIYDDVISGKSLFKDMAVQHSDCSSASYGGDLGEFGKGMMVKPFEEKAFALKVGEVSDPVETNFGYHIIQRNK